MAFDETDEQGYRIVTPTDGLNYDEKGEDGVRRDQDYANVTEHLQQVTENSEELRRRYREKIGRIINPDAPVPSMPLERPKRELPN